MKLILLPGMHGSAELFNDFAAALPVGLTAQVIGYPNDQILRYPDLLNLVAAVVPAEPYIIVAESFSTPLSIHFAATNPPNLKGLVLAAGFASSPLRGPLRLIAGFLTPLLPILPAGVAGAIMVSGTHPPHSTFGRLRDAINSVQPRVFVDRARTALACNALADLQKISVPVLYLQSRYDRIVHSACLDEILKVKPDVEAVTLDGSHVLLQTMPRETAAIVADFVRRCGDKVR
jgi:pimeloyl-ACP methyl ester carboxylesterase